VTTTFATGAVRPSAGTGTPVRPGNGTYTSGFPSMFTGAAAHVQLPAPGIGGAVLLAAVGLFW